MTRDTPNEQDSSGLDATPHHPQVAIQTLDQCLRRHARERAGKVFWRHVARAGVVEISFGRLLDRATAFAHAIRRAGAGQGDIVLIFLPHHPDTVAAFFGAMLAGAVPSFMPCPSAKQQPEIYWPAHAALLKRIGRPLLLSDRANAAQMRAHGMAGGDAPILAIEDVADDATPLPDSLPDPDAIALLQHSSGTTALKKGVALSHRVILRQVASYAASLEMNEADGIVSWLPLYHDMGLIACTVAPLVLGQTVTSLDPFDWVTRPALLLDAIDRHDGRFAWMPNFGFEHLVRTVPPDCRADLSRLRAFINCSEPCKPETFARFAERFAPLGLREDQLQVCYAMAETVFAVSQTPPGAPPRALSLDAETLYRHRVAADPAEPGAGLRVLSTGRPIAGMQVAICHGPKRLPDNHVGEIVLGGAMLFDRYFNDPQTTAARLRNGRYHTRDMGFMRDGEVYVLGRIDDLLIINGRNLYAHEVEAVAAGVPGLKPGRAVAFGVTNPATGSQDLIVVAERDPAQKGPVPAEIGPALRRAIFDQTNIEAKSCRVTEPGWLVKTTSGKISRDANREKYLAERHAPVASASRPAAVTAAAGTVSKIAAFLGRTFKVPAAAITRATTASDVEGWDSLAHATVMLGIEKRFGVRFEDAEMFAFACVGDLADRVDALLAERGAAPARDRFVHDTKRASIARLGDSAGPDIVVFAGMARGFGGRNRLEFASVFARVNGGETTKYFITDRGSSWYTRCFDEVADRLNALSDKPKILVGTSMGGYAALRFSAVLNNVIAVVAIAPQSRPPHHACPPGIDEDVWTVRPVPGMPYCVLYGEIEDEVHKQRLATQFTDPARQRMIIVPNCGHNVAPYLNEIGLLDAVLACSLHTDTMADDIAAIIATITPDPDRLAQRIAEVRETDTRRRAKRES